MKNYYARQNSYQALIDTIHKISEVNRFAFVSCYLEIAGIQREKLKDIPAAITSYRQILKAEPHYLDGWKELQLLYKQQQQWNDYIESSEKLLDLIPGNARADRYPPFVSRVVPQTEESSENATPS